MAKLNKIVNGNYIGPNKYRITDSSDGKKEIVFSPDQTLVEGTPVGAEILNEIQNNGLYYLEGIKRVSGQTDIYDCTLEGIDQFEFKQLAILFKPNADSSNSTVQLNISGQIYTVNSTDNKLKANINIGLLLTKSNKTAYSWMDLNKKLDKGNVSQDFDTAEKIVNALENNGGLQFDKDLFYLNDNGNKKLNHIYCDRNKKGYFKCIKATSSTVNSTEFFEDISNNFQGQRLNSLEDITSRRIDGAKSFSGLKQYNTFMEFLNELQSKKQLYSVIYTRPAYFSDLNFIPFRNTEWEFTLFYVGEFGYKAFANYSGSGNSYIIWCWNNSSDTKAQYSKLTVNI